MVASPSTGPSMSGGGGQQGLVACALRAKVNTVRIVAGARPMSFCVAGRCAPRPTRSLHVTFSFSFVQGFSSRDFRARGAEHPDRRTRACLPTPQPLPSTGAGICGHPLGPFVERFVACRRHHCAPTSEETASRTHPPSAGIRIPIMSTASVIPADGTIVGGSQKSESVSEITPGIRIRRQTCQDPSCDRNPGGSIQDLRFYRATSASLSEDRQTSNVRRTYHFYFGDETVIPAPLDLLPLD